MHHRLRPLAFAALAACASGAFAATPNDVPPLGKLPRWAVPQDYALDFRVDPRQTTYTGTATITVDLKQPADHLWLHGRDLDVSKATIADAAGESHPAQYRAVAEQEGVAEVGFGRVLEPGRYTLTIAFSAPFNTRLEGLYKVSHKGVPYAVTQMEPISARYAFPGFDEPSFKTPFKLSVSVPQGQAAVANTLPVKEQKLADGWTRYEFAPTRPLPTYLVAFAAGPWDVVKGPDIPATPWRDHATPLYGVAAQGEGRRLERALAQTPAIVTALEDYFGYGYPFDKVALVAAPDFSAGAMENPGLVTFRDWLLLLDPNSPAYYVRASFNVSAHELAHQWFGDTVTMPWWNDIWLNEAFATWMQGKITQQLRPSYRADLDRIEGAQYAMGNDSLVSARRIRQPIENNGDIETAFDGITYQKGAAVLGMFERYVGADVFQQGIRAYVREHAFGNATADDLIAALAKASGKGERFERAMKSFLDQSGVPLVRTELDCDHGKPVLQLKQSRYLPLGSRGETDRLWGVPVCVRYGAGGGTQTQCELLDRREGRMTLAGAQCPAWYMPNADAAGYYRFSMPQADFDRLTVAIGRLSDREQLAYADAVDAAFRRGDLDAAAVLAAMRTLAGSKTRQVATALIPAVTWIWRYEARNDAERKRLAEVTRELYLPRLQALGYERRAGEADDDALLRGSLASFLGLEVKLPEVRQALLAQADKALRPKADGRLDLTAANPDLLGTSLAVGVQERGKPAVDALLAELARNSEPAQRNAMLGGVGAATDAAQATRVRDFALDPKVKVGEMAMLLGSSRDKGAGRESLWTWFTAHYDAVVARTDSFAGGELPALIARGGCSQAEADRLQAFFQPRLDEITGAARGLAQTREQIELCTALRAKQDPAAILR
ncbi:M1 family metallopeptidase [Mizugakiibacter sediminis]|uniref:Aminopeptidase n=1 Tax=Mizugakiibacter sediminis TaxID=1475481 RepID=A0A0S6YZP5_9GAMM|nr:M1 family aminopeptidase [Mizugakiibacter sediminis]